MKSQRIELIYKNKHNRIQYGKYIFENLDLDVEITINTPNEPQRMVTTIQKDIFAKPPRKLRINIS